MFSGDATVHWTAVHWDTDMENQQTMKKSSFASKKAVHARPPRPVTAPTPTPHLSHMTQKRISDSTGSSISTIGSHDSPESGSECSSESDSEPEAETEHQDHMVRGDMAADSDQLPDRCLRDRCLRPLHKLQQQSFVPDGKNAERKADPRADPSGLVWQDSGFMTPFTPELLVQRRGQAREISTAATGVTTVQGSGAPSCICKGLHAPNFVPVLFCS